PPHTGVQGGEPAPFQGPVLQGEEPGLRHRPVRPGGVRVGALRGGPEVPALGGLGGESAALVRDRSQGDAYLRVGTEVRYPDSLREGRGPGAGGAEEGGALADQRSFNRMKSRRVIVVLSIDRLDIRATKIPLPPGE